MGRSPLTPAQLIARPFTTAEAREAGLQRWHLDTTSWRRLGPRIYASTGLADSPALRLRAAALRLPSVAAFSGRTAAWLHGIDVEPCDPIEATIPKGIGISARSGLALRRAALAECDVVVVHGWRITSIERTLEDLCSRASLTESVVFLDMALHARLVDVTLLKTYADGRARRAGVVNFRRAVSFAEAATESPMESRLRMLLVLSGLPRPQAQVSLIDRQGRFVGRADLYYPAARLVIEYDGGNHRDRLVEDNRRQNLMVNAGFRLLRFTAADIRNRPDVVAAQVRGALSARPY